MEKQVQHNFIYNLAYQLLVMLVPLVTAPYVSRVLGPENLGIYEYTLSISAYFILFGTIGSALYGQRQVAYCKEDGKAVSKLFWELFAVRSLGMLLMMALFGLCFVLQGNVYRVYFGILLLELLGALVDISWFFQGLERFKVTILRNSIVKLVSVVAIFAFVKSAGDLKIYFWIYVLSIVLGNLSLWCNLPGLLHRVAFRELELRPHLRPMLRLFLPQIAVQIYTVFDKTMLGLLLPEKSQVGFYGQAQKLIKTVISLVTALGTVMLPHIAGQFAKGDEKAVKESIYRSFRIVSFLAFPLVFGLMVVAPSFVPCYYGPGYEPVIGLLRLGAVIIYFIGLSNVVGIQFLLPTNREKQYTLSVLLGSGINFLLNLFLIPFWGALGATLATVLAECSVTVAQMVMTRKDLDYRRVGKSVLGYLVVGLVMFGVCYLTESLLRPGLLCLLVQLAVGAGVYLTGAALLYRRFDIKWK